MDNRRQRDSTATSQHTVSAGGSAWHSLHDSGAHGAVASSQHASTQGTRQRTSSSSEMLPFSLKSNILKMKFALLSKVPIDTMPNAQMAPSASILNQRTQHTMSQPR